jgi:hypothetical protein
MRRTLVAILCLLLFMAVPIGIILGGPPNIVTPPERMMLTADDLPAGWIGNDRVIEYHFWPGHNWSALVWFRNESLEMNPALTVGITSYNSSALAHEEYLGTLRGLDSAANITNVDFGDEGHRQSLPYYWVEYVFRVDNILVHVDFWTSSPTPYEPWMDEIVRLQESKIH